VSNVRNTGSMLMTKSRKLSRAPFICQKTSVGVIEALAGVVGPSGSVDSA